MFGHVLGHDILDKGAAHVGDGSGDAVVLIRSTRWSKSPALVVLDVVELQQILADVEVRASTFCGPSSAC